MDEEIGKKLEELAKKVNEENKAKELANKQEEDERSRLDREFQQEKENLLTEIKKELDEFEPKLLPLRRDLYDKQEILINSNLKCHIVATKDRRIGISVSSPTMNIGGYPSIYSLADNTWLKPYILNILKSFLNRLKPFEKYYADNVEKYLK